MLNRIKIFLTFLLLGIGISLFTSHPAQAQGSFIRGDINGDGVVDTVDLRLVLPVNNDEGCRARHDVNDDGDFSAADPDYLENYLFFGGPPPPHPFPNCGFDTTLDFVSCQFSSCCTLATACNDKIDNDGDGFTDYPDDICCTNACDTLETAGNTQCSDGLDNDGDGFVDLEDCTCNDSCDNSEEWVDQCRDGIDNDGDKFIDLDDCGCSDTCDLEEGPQDQCRDGIDNDGDGLIDLADPACCNNCTSSEFFLYRPCDVDGNGNWTLIDVIGLVGMVFKGAAKPSPLCRADCNASGGSPTLTDIVYLVNKVFKGGPTPLLVGDCCKP